MMTVIGPQDFIPMVKELKFPNTFNPYVDRCKQYDKPHAPEIRTGLLLDILRAASKVDIDAIWIGRDLGHRGGRRTGLALTDDFQFPIHNRRWGVDVERPTLGPMIRERTASVVWEMLKQINKNIFLWNLFPLHPFPKDDIYRNRAHNGTERKAGIELLHKLLMFLRPRRIIAIGKDSEQTLRNAMLAIDIWDVRHPSYGGEKLFREQISSLYGL